LKPKTAKAPRRVAGARRSERHTGGGGASTGPGDGGSRPLRGTQPADLQVPSDFHALYDRGVRAARGVAPMAPRRDTRGHRRLAAAVEGLEVHYDEHTGSPNLVVSREPDAQLSRRSRGTPAEAVTQFLAKRGDLWGLTPEDADSIEVLSVSEPRGAARAAESPSPRRAR
jgi:hypothetical protein